MISSTRSWVEESPLRIMVATMVLCSFVILGVLAYAIINTNIRVSESIETVEDGTTCMLWSIYGTENVQRPAEENAEAACRRFLEDRGEQ